MELVQCKDQQGTITLQMSDIFASDHSEDLGKINLELKRYVQQLQKERDAYRNRSEGSDALTQCLQEEREENKKLCNKIKRIEEQYSLYQSKYPADKDSMNSPGEMSANFAPGTSKQLLENLVRENRQLQQNLKALVGDPRKLEQMQLRMEEIEEEKAKLEHQLKLTKLENEKQRNIMDSSPQNKDMEIAKLQAKIDYLEKSKNNQDDVCQSLSEESENLRQQLKELAVMCQHLAKKLEERDAKLNCGTVDNIPAAPSVCVEQSIEGFAKMKIMVADLTAELSKTKSQLSELLAANNKWETYSKEREIYFNRLQQKVKELKESNHRLHSEMDARQNQKEDCIIEGYKKKIGEMEEEKEEIENENRLLRIANQHQQDELAILNRQLQYRGLQNTGIQRPEDHERIQVLEAQIQICTDDFRQEREDREKAQAYIAELTAERDLLKRQLEQFQVSYMTHLHNQRIFNLSNYRNEYANQIQQQAQHPAANTHFLARGGIVEDCDDDGDDDDEVADYDIVDSVPSQNISSVSPATTKDAVLPDNSLVCPKCHTDFPANNHKEFLEHIDECCT